MENQVTTHAFKGLLIALVLIILSLVAQFTNIQFEKWYGYIYYIISIAAFILSVILFGKQKDNNVTFGELFTHGFKTTAVTSGIVFIYTVLAFYFIFPETIDQFYDKAMEEVLKSGKATTDQLEKTSALTKKILTVSMLAGSLIATLILGTIGSLIGAGVAKKNPAPTPFEQQ